MPTRPTPSFVSQHAGPQVKLVFYNVGIQNNEVTGRDWRTKTRRMENDIKQILPSHSRVQGVLISEFGNMHISIDHFFDERARTTALNKSQRSRGGILQSADYCVVSENAQTYFERMMRHLELDDVDVFARPPYIALIRRSHWHVISCTIHDDLCSIKANTAQLLKLQHIDRGVTVNVANCHIPSPAISNQRRKDTIETLLGHLGACGSAQPSGATVAWIMGGDLNTPPILLKQTVEPYVQAVMPFLSSSNAMPRNGDFAISQGLQLREVIAWVGCTEDPQNYVSDAHDIVAVVGDFRLKSENIVFHANTCADTSSPTRPKLTEMLARTASEIREQAKSDHLRPDDFENVQPSPGDQTPVAKPLSSPTPAASPLRRDASQHVGLPEQLPAQQIPSAASGSQHLPQNHRRPRLAAALHSLRPRQKSLRIACPTRTTSWPFGRTYNFGRKQGQEREARTRKKALPRARVRTRRTEERSWPRRFTVCGLALFEVRKLREKTERSPAWRYSNSERDHS